MIHVSSESVYRYDRVKRKGAAFLTNLFKSKKLAVGMKINEDEEMERTPRVETPAIITNACRRNGSESDSTMSRIPSTLSVTAVDVVVSCQPSPSHSILTLTPGRTRNIDQDMEALRLSRQDNPFLQVLASRESLVESIEESESDDAILMSQKYKKIYLKLAKTLWTLVDNPTKVSRICGVPYTALPLATLISVEEKIPMLMKRKEAKSYGTKNLIEGIFLPGENCVIIEDVITSGSSILETVDVLKKENLSVTEAYVLIDREQGGKRNLENHEIKVKSLFVVTQLMKYLLEAGKITPEIVKDVDNYLAANRAPSISVQGNFVILMLLIGVPDNRLKLSYSKRAKLTTNPLASKLLELMESKQTNLCLAADLTKMDAILELANIAGPHIAVLKTHVDIIEDFNENFIFRLKELARQHRFLLMEDRKFGDIGNTVSLQYRYGFYKIAEWADLITVHPISGVSVIDALKKSLDNITEPRGIFLVAEMSCKGALTTGDYLKNAVSMAEEVSDLVVGFVCQSNLSAQPGLLQLTPGVKLAKSVDGLGQQYNDPQSVINAGADLAVVGRGITEACNGYLKATLEYKKELWNAYEERINISST
ncbi:Uridine 5'-monophosphate synthase [Trachymyrmex septentrionalis]|uniref:Orotidine 5'-phosphate decarboxylase n=1 Tax=Trachymyrmex septentrionalis TaxID=34720 RepID=A0A195F700_9HYME|nr:Uridine 5'-monophosphate synthase [Trachymyrmex septentrionalis]